MQKNVARPSATSLFNPFRRHLLKAGIATGSLFGSMPYALVWAQSEGTLKLLRLPKIALVFGNSKYKDAPLKNPSNDAKAIGKALTDAGFSVTARLDASRADMTAAIDAFLKELAAKKCVGLFYYAGHGVQLAWKNYMLPVDADIDTVDDVQKQAMDLTRLMNGLANAANPLNVIILDACRDNPFGTAKQLQQKGLSQMDAPINTILAYATSPGNVASDGEGANGLYTENLLREVRVQDAKIEDVFKRVRLGVRRRSNGQQIPWESTSLEEDFYFLPPKEFQKLSDAEAERQFQAELAIWVKIKDAREPAPLEEYLRKYPSGYYAELAQFQLDRVLARQGEKKIEAVNAPENPYTKGNARIDTHFKIGDSYNYREFDLYTKIETRQTANRITNIIEDQVIFNDGRVVTDLFGNQIKTGNGNVFTGAQYFVPNYEVGKKWATRFTVTYPGGEVREFEIDFRVAARETVTVPAGKFDAFRVEGSGGGRGGRVNVYVNPKYWMAPGIRWPVAKENKRQANGRVIAYERIELTAYVQQ